MRYLAAYAFVVSVLAAALGLQLAHERRVNADLRARPPAIAAPAVAPRVVTGARSFRARNGVVLGPAELDRIDEADRQMDRVVAEFEYSMSKQRLPNARTRSTNPR